MQTVELGEEIVLPVQGRHDLPAPRPPMEIEPPGQGVQAVAFVVGVSKSWELS